jgi:NADH dehydrogenase
VTGDAAAADTGDGHLALQSCQHALQLGRYAGENAARDILGLRTVPYVQLEYDTCLDLGRSGAVFTDGWERKVVESGSVAKARKQRINRTVIYPPSTARPELLLTYSSTDPRDQTIASLIRGPIPEPGSSATARHIGAVECRSSAGCRNPA